MRKITSTDKELNNSINSLNNDYGSIKQFYRLDTMNGNKMNMIPEDERES